MKVVVEALGLTAGGGKGIVSELLPALARRQEHEFVAILARAPAYGSMGAPNLKIMEFEKPQGLLRRALFLNRTVPAICREEQADALLCLGNFAPRRLQIPAIISLRNAFFVSPPTEACRGLSLRERLIVRYARWHLGSLPDDVFLTVETELMREQLLSSYPVEPSQVAVISNGDGLLPRPNRGRTERVYRTEHPFTFLCLARYYPHKNIEMCVEAMKTLALTGQQARLLITVDAADHPRARTLLQRIRRDKWDASIENLGTVAQSELPRIFGSADAVLLPTLLESFSRTFLEAMHYELPILTSDRDFARRICGEAAVYFDPLDAESVAAAMARVMDDEALRRELVVRGLKEAARFPGWDKIAAQFVTALESVAAGRGLRTEVQPDFAGAAL